METRYKLYKSGKNLVTGRFVVAVVTALSVVTNVSYVNADTVSNDTKQVAVAENATQNSNTVQLSAANQVTSETEQKDEVTVPEITSNVPTSVDNSTTQEQVKTAIDNAQDTEIQNLHAGAVAQGQADLANADASIDAQVAEAMNNGVDVDVKTISITPDYQSVNGLFGQQLLSVIQSNIKLYQDAVKQAVDKSNATAQGLQRQLAAYKKAVSDYQAGIASSTGLKWGNDTYVTGDNKMSGNEVVLYGDQSIKVAAKYAIQGGRFDNDKNTDANFDNIFKINGSGSVNIHNTTNGDVTIKFSNIDSPNNSGTYVAVWGADDGSIDFGVFATYSGGPSGTILDEVYSYDAEVSVTGNVSVVTFNDIDNNQTVTMNGLDGKVSLGKNVSQNGNKFSAYVDVSPSQGTSNELGTNSVRWSLGKASPITFSFNHMTNDHTSVSIVGGIFGDDSNIPQEEPQKPTLSAEKFTVVAPDVPQVPAPEKPTPDAPQVPAPEVPTPNAPQVPAPEVPTPDVPQVLAPVVSKENVTKNEVEALPAPKAPIVKKEKLPKTGAEEASRSYVLGGVLAGVAGLGLLGTFRRVTKK